MSIVSVLSLVSAWTACADQRMLTRDALLRTLLRVPAAPSQGDTAEAIRALDIDNSGVVDENEIRAFAAKVGLRTEDALNEFKQLDKNGDGKLGLDEVSTVLDQDSTDAVPNASLEQAQKKSLALNVADVAEAPKGPEDQAGLQAGRLVATTFAQRAATVLKQRAADEAKAKELEQLANQMRGQAATIAQKAATETMNAAKQAASAVLQQEAAHLQELDEKATEAERQAVLRRKQAKVAMDKVLKAQEDVSKQVKLFRDAQGM